MSRLRSIVAALAILLMAVPPLFDTFDTWDKGPEFPVVGHNTETNLVMAGLSVGVCLAVMSIASLLFDWLTALFMRFFRTAAACVTPPQRRATDYLLLLFSPPPWSANSLRI